MCGFLGFVLGMLVTVVFTVPRVKDHLRATFGKLFTKEPPNQP